jgi:hypothetical protein
MHPAMNYMLSFEYEPKVIKEDSCAASPYKVKRIRNDHVEIPVFMPYKRQRKNKSVSFAESCTTVHTIGISDTDDCWLQESDYDEIKRENTETVEQIIKCQGRVSSIDHDKFCVRGLEGAIAKLIGNNNYHMTGKFRTVLLRKQESDVEKFGFIDSNSLSSMSQRHSQHDCSRAARLAQFDAKIS